MQKTNDLGTTMRCFIFVAAGTFWGLALFVQAADYYDVTTVFVAENGWGGGGHDMEYYGQSGSVAGWAVGTTSCNRGTIEAPWYGGTNQTPVIAQNCYRFKDGRFEQIGMSWLKHSFCAVSEPGCETWNGQGCQPTNCDTLGVGCGDTYWAGLNADADAPRSEINAHTGDYAYPFTRSPSGPSSIRGKLQLVPDDIRPSDNPGARYFIEAQYVEPGESVFATHLNNASYKEVTFNSTTSTSGVGPTKHMIAGIQAWQVCDSAVVISDLQTVEADGAEARGHLGFRTSDNGDGTWHYQYAIHNQNSHRSFRSFSVSVPECVTLTNVSFQDVHYHSGEILEGTDWPSSNSSGVLTWSTQSQSANPIANAIRWGSMYTFSFDANTAPTTTSGFVGYYRSGSGDGLSVSVDAPSDNCGGGTECPGDLNGDNLVNVEDLLEVLAWYGSNAGQGDADGDGDCDVEDLLLIIGVYGASC